ncbi:MAG: hypothetical protein ABSF98_02415 [Bryobacteraceae bacterium]|jgi:hypothetical protein
MRVLVSSKTRLAIELALAVFAAGLSWEAVGWALRPGLSMMLDELSNLTWFLWGPYSNAVHFFPTSFYSDRPIGFAFIRLLTDLFGLDYTRQVACQLAIHLANCLLAFLLFRRLGAGVPLSLAGIGLWGSLSATALTATYLGEAFDVICLFFLLGSTLAVLSEKRGAAALSAVLFLAALRSKEFAIVTPFLLTVLVGLQPPRLPFRQTLARLGRRLWMHYLILTVFGLRYLFLLPRYLAIAGRQDPYHMDFRMATVLNSLSWYTAQVFGVRSLPPLMLAVLLAAIFAWAVVRRRAGMAFGLAAYVLTLLPVCFMPNIRVPYWLYAPQLFLILAVCLLLEEVLALCCAREGLRWAAAACIALVCLSAATRFRRSPVLWHMEVRRACMRTASDARVQLPRLGPGTHLYVNNGRETPWLFLAGPCDYFKVISKQQSIFCVLGRPADQLRALYESDKGPKYFVDYRKDGSITVAATNGGY